MDLEQARTNMVKQQLCTWDVFEDNILELFSQLPREAFMPPLYQALALADLPIPLGHGEATWCPKEEARVLQALAITKDQSVLEIGTGCGYFTALLAQLANHVFSVDIHADFISAAQRHLEKFNLQNTTLWVGNGLDGIAEYAPYDVIVITGAVTQLPKSFKNQLKIGGRLFAIFNHNQAMQAMLLTKLGHDEWHTRGLFETAVKPLVVPTKKAMEFSF